MATLAVRGGSSAPLVLSENLERRQLMAVFFVDTNNPVASDNNPGTINLPLKTINQALTLASNNNLISQSDTIEIRGGVYHEQPNLWASDSGTSATDRTVITAYVNPSTGSYEPVYIDAGDPTTGTWTQVGSTNVWYLSNFSTETAGVWVDWSPGNDGASLQQIGGYNETSADRKITGSGVSDMYPGTYYGDLADSRLYVWLADGSNPNQHTIEYANRSWAIYNPGTPVSGGGYSYANHVDLIGLNLRHTNEYGTAGQDPGVAIYTEDDQRLINCNIQWNTRDGVHLLGTSQMINCVSSNNGGNGVAAKGNGFSISGGEFDYNYWRQYNDGSDAAIKVITNNPTIYGNIENIEASYNYGKGIWFDTCFENSVVSNIIGNYIHDNQDTGIDLEASRNFLVANNVVVNNQNDGIALNAVENARIYNNTIVGNYGVAAIELDGGTRDQGTTYPGTVGMLNNSIENNIIANNFTAYDLDVPTSAAGSSEINNNTSDYNLFYRRGGALHFTTGGTYLGTWGNTPSTLSSWQTASGQDAHSIAGDPQFISGGSGALAYEIGSNSPAKDVGANVSSAVTTDYSGTTRPQFSGLDIGAFEYISGGLGTPGPVVVNSNPAMWFDDQLPSNAAMTTPDQYDNQDENRFWQWNSSTVYSGSASLDSTAASGAHRQYFTGADARVVGSSDILFGYVWIDPANLPSQIMFEWQDSGGSWSHQAYWGQNLIGAGVDGSENAQYMGSLPSAGQWVRLEVPASAVGLGGQSIQGFSFDLYNGRALLDEVGNAPSLTTISGSVFNDNNGNGVLDNGEQGLAGRTVFADLNNDGTLDAGDPYSITNSSGGYSFNVSEGTYLIRQIVPSGFTASTVSDSQFTVLVAAGFPATENFGEFSTTLASTTGSFILGLSQDRSTVDIWRNVPENSTPTYSISSSQLTTLTINAPALTVDAGNGTPLPGGGLFFNGLVSGTLSVLGSSTSSNSFAVNSNSVQTNSVAFDYSNVDSISVTGGIASDQLSVSGVSIPVNFNGGGGNDSLSITAGSYSFTSDPQLQTASLAVSVASGASVHFASGQSSSGLSIYHLAGLDLSAGGTAVMDAASRAQGRSVLVLSSLNLGGTDSDPAGVLDLNNNDMIVANADLSAVVGALTIGYNNGTWTGSAGIVSSVAGAGVASLTTLGYSTGISGTFDGQSIGVNDVAIKYTYVGDATLDGFVDGSDYSRIDSALLTGATGWMNGDFNYDGVVNGSDYTLIDNAYNAQGASLAAEISSTPATSIVQMVPSQFNQSNASVSAVLRSKEYIWLDPLLAAEQDSPSSSV